MHVVPRTLPMGGTAQRFWTVAPQATGGSPCLFFHGARGSGRTFRFLLEDLGRRRSVFAPDLPGFGESSPLPGGVRLADYPQALSAWLDALDLHEATVVGHSLGGAMALGVALLRPERVGRLVLIASAGAPLEHRLRTAAAPSREEQIRRAFHDPVRMAEVVQELFPPSPGSPVLPGPTARGSLPDYRERLGDLRMPVLLLWGEADGVTPVEVGRWFQERIPGSRLEIIPEAGHMPHLEQPEETLRHLHGFLDD